MKLFTLEVVQAEFGDCLLLHFGDAQKPKIILIDGGPSNVYENFLKDRLLQIKQKWNPAGKQPIELMMVSHIDDDHIVGINAFAGEIQDGTVKFDIKNLWLNSFDDVIGNAEIAAIVKAEKQKPGKGSPGVEAVAASVAKGRVLRDIATDQTWLVNSPFPKRANGAEVVRGDIAFGAVTIDNIRITVLHPNEERLKKLEKEWDKKLKEAKKKGDKSISVAAATTADTSVYNLSSIVCLVKAGTKSMLLTGDARSKDIYDGLAENNLLDANGKIHVDVLKMPHHGSIRNMTQQFLEDVTADHYVISANGKYDNPDTETLDLFAKVVKSGTLHMTNKTGEKGLTTKVTKFLNKLQNGQNGLSVEFPKTKGDSIIIDLGDAHLNY